MPCLVNPVISPASCTPFGFLPKSNLPSSSCGCPSHLRSRPAFCCATYRLYVWTNRSHAVSDLMRAASSARSHAARFAFTAHLINSALQFFRLDRLLLRRVLLCFLERSDPR